MAVSGARLVGAGLRGGGRPSRPRHCLDGLAKAAFHARGGGAHHGPADESVRAIWRGGPGSYGRNDAGDAAMDAAFLSKEVGAPVRVQYMRADATGWDPKGPASVHYGRAGIDAQGNVVAYSFDSNGILAHRGRQQRERSPRHARRATPRDAGEPEARVRLAGRGVRVCEQAPLLAGRPPAPRRGISPSRRAPARSRWAATDLRKRVVHRRTGGGHPHRCSRVSSPIPHGSPRRGGH